MAHEGLGNFRKARRSHKYQGCQPHGKTHRTARDTAKQNEKRDKERREGDEREKRNERKTNEEKKEREERVSQSSCSERILEAEAGTLGVLAPGARLRIARAISL